MPIHISEEHNFR